MKHKRIVYTVCGLIFLSAIPSYSQNEAIAYFDRGLKASSNEEKITNYKKAIELQPNFIEAHFNLGRAYKNIGKFTDAEQSYKTALLCNPGKLDNSLKQTIMYELGIVYEKLAQFENANESLLGAFNLTNDKSIKGMILFRLGQVSTAMKKFEQAITYYRQGIEIYPVNKQTFEAAITSTQNQEKMTKFYDTGLNAIGQNKLAEAITAFNQVITIDPQYKDTEKLLTETKNRLEVQQSLGETKKVYDLGVMHLRNNDWQSAIESFEQVVARSPNYEKAGEYLSLARQNLEISLKTASASRYYNDGIAAADRGDYINAIIAFERVQEIDSNFRNVTSLMQEMRRKYEDQNDRSTKTKLYNQGWLAYEKNNWQEAYDKFNRLAAIDPTYKDVVELIQVCKEKLALATQQESIANYYQKGVEFMQHGDWLNALIHFERVIMIDPDYKDAHILSHQVRQNLNPAKRGLIDMAEATTPSSTRNPLLIIGIILTAIFVPLSGLIVFSPSARARFYLLQKKFDKARQIYENMLNSKPQNIKLYITLANIYLNENRKDEIAVRVFEKVIESNTSENLKHRFLPIVNQYYLERGRLNSSPLRLLEDSLRDELKNMGN